MPEGRLDIEIIENEALDRSIIKQHGIIELKVLRSFGEGGKTYTPKTTREWVKSGVEQAASYRDSKSAKWGALLCFDMRDSDSGENKCFSHVTKLSNDLLVRLKRWYLYAQSSHLRAAQAAAKC